MARRLTDEDRAARALTERELQRAYTRVLRHLDFLVEHHYDSRFSDVGTRGAPDLKILGHGHFFVVELKRWNGTLSPEQKVWLAEYADAGIPAFVHQPQDWAAMLSYASSIAKRDIPPELMAFPRPKPKKKRKRKVATPPQPG